MPSSTMLSLGETVKTKSIMKIMSTEHNNAPAEVKPPVTTAAAQPDNTSNEKKRKGKMLLVGGAFLLAGLGWAA